ncbi:MAG: site-specific integrase [Candidatus Sulfotelmatobacter sp.]
MGEIKVTIYERVKLDNKWTRVRVEIPEGRKRDGRLFLKHDRQGKFQLSWYEKRTKKWQDVTNPNDEQQMPLLSHALQQADDKSWFLNNRHRNIADPTVVAVARKKLADEILSYLEAKSGCKKTVSAHRLALTEFQRWATQQKKGRGIRYVDEITKPLLRQFFDYLVDGNEDDDGPENTPFTAAHKVMKVNSFYRDVFHLEAGKGVITKKDYKRELKSNRVPEIFSKQEIDAMFSVMDEDEHLIFSTIYEAGLRKREWMHLEDTDLFLHELQQRVFNCEIRVESKPHYKYQTKTGNSRNVGVSKELIDRLLRRKATKRTSRLLFGTSLGKPDYHVWDRLKAIAKRAGLDPATVWVHKWRATAATNWLRSKDLGGKGWDIGYVRQQLGHEDLKSIEHYISIIRNEERVLREHALKLQSKPPVRDSTGVDERRHALASQTILELPAEGVAINGTQWS